MKKIKYLLALSCALFFTTTTEAAVVTIGGPGIVLTAHQPVEAVVVAPNGNIFKQTVYYDPAICGVDLDVGWAGPNASVYFPAYQTGYVWYNGFWVDHAGFYWNGGRRLYIGHPHWDVYWGGYWHNHWHSGWHGSWHGGWHDGWHGGWHEGWHGHDWHGGWHGHGGWHHR